MKHYLDASVVLAWLLEGHTALGDLEGESTVGSSRLLWIEVSRVLHRALQTGQLTPVPATQIRHRFARFATGLSQLRLTDGVLNRAEGPFPMVIRSLDALHLASAEVWLESDRSDGLSLWTLDRQMNLCAAQLGFGTPLLSL